MLALPESAKIAVPALSSDRWQSWAIHDYLAAFGTV